MTIARRLYAAALVLMPLTYATKFAVGLPNLTWIDPTLILALVVFLIIWPPIKPAVSLFVFLAAVAGGALGFLFLNIPGSIPSAAYSTMREPIRLGLNLVFFWVSIYFLKREREFTIKWLAISVVCQLVVAVYIWCAAQSLVPLFEPALNFARYYAVRQLVWFGATPIMRLGGTFMESPPFGLFMFGAFAIFSVLIFREKVSMPWLRTGWLASFFGVLGSFSDQILLAFFFLLISSSVLMLKGKSRTVGSIVAALLLLAITPYLANRIMDKISEGTNLKAYEAMGQSGGERFFHTAYSIGLLIDHPEAIPLGIGPGRYGDYASVTGVFPSTVTPQVTVIEWLVEHGVVGLALMLLFLYLVAVKSAQAYGPVGPIVVVSLLLADLFQGNWKWEAWFFALAFLYAAPSFSRTSPEIERT